MFLSLSVILCVQLKTILMVESSSLHSNVLDHFKFNTQRHVIEKESSPHFNFINGIR